MRRLKYILNSSRYLYLIILIIIITGDIIFTRFYPHKSKYHPNDTDFNIRINTYQIEGDKLTITGTGKEKLVINYYFKNQEEKDNFPKEYHLNDLINITGTLEKPTKNTIPNTFNYQEYLYQNNIYYLLNANNIVKSASNTELLYYLKDLLLKRINNLESSSYLKIFILGDKRDLSNKMTSIYNNNGIIHLFSISGMHISLFTSCIFLLTKKLSYNYRYPYYITIIFLVLYALLIGLSPSILRSIIMYIIFTINKIYQIKIKKINLLILVLSIVLIIKPFYFYSIGFQLSFLISSIIILLNKRINKYRHPIKKLLIMSIISFLISLPLVLYNTYQINYLSILINLFFIPLVTYLIFPMSIITVIFPIIEPIFILLINLLEYINTYFNNLNTIIIFNKPSLLFIYIYYIILFTMLYTKKVLLLISIIILLIILKVKPFFNNNMNLTFLDVGEGDSYLINYPHQRGSILIDTGGIINYQKEEWREREPYSLAISKTIPYLKSLGITKINYLILTHGDNDHMGEAINLINNFKVEKVIFNCGLSNKLENSLISLLKKKKIKYYFCIQELKIDKHRFIFLNTKEYDNENDNSSVIYFNYHQYQFLFMGDAGINKEKDILNKYQLKDINFLKVGHHGSDTSSSKEFIEKINPKTCLISVGKNNRYNHPEDNVINLLESYCDIYRTDQDGSVEIKLNKNKYIIKTHIP